MRLIRFKQNSKIFYGVHEGEFVCPVDGDIYGDFVVTAQKIKIAEVKLLSPCVPTKVLCIGKNYQDHIKEMGYHALPENPILFMKPITAVIGPGEEIIYPEISKRIDYEAELVVVLKNKVKNISPQQVKENILGYTCGNDVTARDLQKKDGQWTRGKSFDTFCPLGPWIETEINPEGLTVKSYLNGELRQSSSTSFLLFPVYELVSFISHIMTLSPGDAIMTGTPAGVGPMHPGDEIEIVIKEIGSLKNKVVAEILS